MNISVASSSLISIPIIESILTSNHALVSIISNPDKKSGRGQKLVANELAQWAQEKGLPVAKPIDNSELNRHLHSAQPQIVVTAAYGKLIPIELLHGPRFGWLNLHFSLLPKWRGAAPVQWSLMSGETETGITIFRLDKGMDTGPIYFQERLEILERERTSQLLDRMSIRGGEVILEIVSSILSGVKPKPQPLTGATLAPKISKELGKIDWQKSTLEILNLDRAIGDRPGIYALLEGERLALHGLVHCEISGQRLPFGSLQGAPDGLIVITGDGALIVQEVTPAGKKRMSAVEFLRGARLEDGVRFDVG